MIQDSVQSAHLATANGNLVEGLRSVDNGLKIVTGNNTDAASVSTHSSQYREWIAVLINADTGGLRHNRCK